MTKQYELILMFSVEQNDVSAEKGLAEKAKKYKVKVVTLDKWGVKTLAYPIKKQTKAYYLRYLLEAEPADILEFEKAVRMDETVIRYLMVNYQVKKLKKEAKIKK